MHPVADTVSTTVYLVVTSGVTVGFEIVDVKPIGIEVQLYVLPVTGVAPRVVLVLKQIDLSVPGAATGSLLGVKITSFIVLVPQSF